MKNIIILLILLTVTVNARPNYPDNVNEIVKERIFEPMKQCLPETEIIKLKGLNNNEIEELKLLGFGACKNCKYSDNICCYLYAFNYLNTDSVNNIIINKELLMSRFTIINELSDLFTYEFYRYLTNQSYDIKKVIDSLDSIRLFYESQDIDSLENDSIYGVYIPYDLDEALDRMHVFFCNDTEHLEFIQKTEDDAVAYEHLNASLTMRAYWGLHGGSRLWNYFNKLGITNGDRISSILMRLYYRKIHDLPRNFQELIDAARRYELEEQQYLQKQEIEEKLECYKNIEKANQVIKLNKNKF